jgi:hypothetical protein
MFLEKLRRRSRWLNRNNLAVLIVLTGLVGCDHFHVDTVSPDSGYVRTIDEFLPLNAGQKSALFTVDGTKTNYAMKTVISGSSISFQAISAGNLVDEEIYDVQGHSILLKRAAGENFEPPITLLKSPLNVGDHYSWKGVLACEIEKIEGHATITSSNDFVPVKDKSEEAVKVEVDLKFGQGANRKLSFWFVKGKGVLKTEIFKNIREPKL